METAAKFSPAAQDILQYEQERKVPEDEEEDIEDDAY